APLVVWGSSYSAALAWRAAGDHPDLVDAVAAFSTAAGGPFDQCGAPLGLPKLADPGLAVWPQSEEGRIEPLRPLLTAKNVEIYIVPNGVHGSSMLVDERTKHDMSEARELVAAFL